MNNGQGRPQAYQFWYKSSQDAPTEYIYIIAFTYKQAVYLFHKAGYNRMYDYSNYCCDTIPCAYWLNKHDIGDILGQNAVV